MDPMRSGGATYPLSLARIYSAARRRGHSLISTPQRLLALLGNYALSIIDSPAEGELMTVVTTHNTPLSFASLRDVGEFVNDWNHDCLTPYLTVNYDNPEHIHITGTTTIDSQWGLSDAQLDIVVDQALGNAEVFIHELLDRFPHLHTESPAEVIEDLEPDLADAPFEDLTAPVTQDRIVNALEAAGIYKLQHVDESSIYAWINDVLFSFSVDNGPTLVIKGHWDPNLAGADFMKVFLICNDFNKSSQAPVAYTHSNVEGMQVRLDMTEPIGAGLSDHQLRSVVGRSLKLILHGVDHIAREVTGHSPVAWP